MIAMCSKAQYGNELHQQTKLSNIQQCLSAAQVEPDSFGAANSVWVPEPRGSFLSCCLYIMCEWFTW